MLFIVQGSGLNMKNPGFFRLVIKDLILLPVSVFLNIEDLWHRYNCCLTTRNIKRKILKVVEYTLS